MSRPLSDDRGLLSALIGDGRPLLTLTAVGLILSGLFALFLSVTGHFLPHDIAYLEMTAQDLCGKNQCRIVHFMFHDRVSFGGALIAVGTLYLWLCAFPLREGQPWAWWTLAASGLVGFSSFLTYLGYGYLDSWHGTATLGLLPMFLVGLGLSRRRLASPGVPTPPPSRSPALRVSRALLLATAAGLVLGGLIIMTVGMTTVFVPQDLEYMGVTVRELQAINPRLIPLIAHDRAGFGGGVACCGLTMFLCIWFGRPSRALWQTLFFTGVVGFATAIAVHPIVGYNSFTHLAPACLGAALFIGGIALAYTPMCRHSPGAATVMPALPV